MVRGDGMVSMVKGRDGGKIDRRFGWRQGWAPVNSFLISFKLYVFMHVYVLCMVLLNLKNHLMVIEFLTAVSLTIKY